MPDLFLSPDWRPVVMALVAVMALTLVWTYARSQAAWWVRLVCGLLKAAGFALLGFCLLEPMKTTEIPKQGANLLVVMADASQSLKIRDAGTTASREEQLRAKIVDDTSWQENLDDAFELRKFTFARQVRSSDYSSFQAEGIGSSVLSSLQAMQQRYQGQPLAGIILLTDGNATDLADESIDWSSMPPVYPVVVGAQQSEDDVRIAGFSVSQTNFEAAPVNISAELAAVGFEGEKIRAQLLDEAGTVVDEQFVRNRNTDDLMAVRFKVRPEQPGVSVYRLRVASEDQTFGPEDPEYVSEATMVNNERIVMVNRARGPYGILYVSGRPNWEFKFLHRAMKKDDEIDLVGLIRIAREEPKFTFRSHRNESTNPLFRGFGNERDEDAERYDEPVLVPVGRRNREELQDGFPKTAEELFQYRAIILDDIEAGFFTEEQKNLIEKFVVDRGGGFLMLGGQESFHEGGYDRTPIGELLPVYIDRRAAKNEQSEYSLVLTREGWLQPWVRLESTEQEENLRMAKMPKFGTVNAVQSIKPGASVLATVQGSNREQWNALVAQRSGKGRSAALMIGDFWRWHLRSEPGNDDMMKAWRQMLRWLIADVSGKVEVQTKQLSDSNLSVQLRVSVKNQAFKPIDDATVQVTVTRPDKTTLTLSATSADEAAGLYVVNYVPRQAGAYRVSVSATANDGSSLGEARGGWVSEPAKAEFERLEPNRKWLQELAAKTGGKMVSLNELDRLSRELPAARAPVMETKISPWWHRSSIFLLALALLVSEWGIRRWKGLP